jgi:hypothetical protein
MDFMRDPLKAASLCGDDVEDGTNTFLPSKLRLLPRFFVIDYRLTP